LKRVEKNEGTELLGEKAISTAIEKINSTFGEVVEFFKKIEKVHNRRRDKHKSLFRNLPQCPKISGRYPEIL
jgi:hypothetical protein